MRSNANVVKAHVYINSQHTLNSDKEKIVEKTFDEVNAQKLEQIFAMFMNNHELVYKALTLKMELGYKTSVMIGIEYMKVGITVVAYDGDDYDDAPEYYVSLYAEDDVSHERFTLAHWDDGLLVIRLDNKDVREDYFLREIMHKFMEANDERTKKIYASTPVILW